MRQSQNSTHSSITAELISPAEDGDQHHGPGALHLIQDSGGNAGEFPQTLVVEIAHGDAFELIAHVEALVGRHEIPCVGLLQLTEPVHDRPAQNADQQQN